MVAEGLMAGKGEMELNQAQYERIADCFQKPRGTLRYDNFQVLNAILYIAENGAKRR